MSDFPTRVQKAAPDLRLAALLMYVLQQDDPEDYVILLMAKAQQYLYRSQKGDLIMALLKLDEKEFYTRLNRLRERGWIGVEKGCISVINSGDMEFWRIIGWVSNVLGNYKQNKPLPKWKKQSKKSKR